MKHSLLFLFFSLSITVGACAQATEPTPAAYEAVPQYEVKVDQQASYPGGATGVMHYIGRHIRYPVEAMKQSVQGKVFVKFTVGADGQIVKTDVIKTDHDLLSAAAINAVTGMPGWKPASLNEQPIEVSYVFPVVFKWEGMKKEKGR